MRSTRCSPADTACRSRSATTPTGITRWDRFGAWVAGPAPSGSSPIVLLQALKAGAYYSTQGPRDRRGPRRSGAGARRVQPGAGDRAHRHPRVALRRGARRSHTARGDARPQPAAVAVLASHGDRRGREARLDQPGLDLEFGADSVTRRGPSESGCTVVSHPAGPWVERGDRQSDQEVRDVRATQHAGGARPTSSSARR